MQRYFTPEGYVRNEGDIGVGLKAPYKIAYGSLVPKRAEGENLLESVFMILGQSAATAAVLALDQGIGVQDVKYPELRVRLLKDGQLLELPR